MCTFLRSRLRAARIHNFLPSHRHQNTHLRTVTVRSSPPRARTPLTWQTRWSISRGRRVKDRGLRWSTLPSKVSRRAKTSRSEETAPSDRWGEPTASGPEALVRKMARNWHAVILVAFWFPYYKLGIMSKTCQVILLVCCLHYVCVSGGYSWNGTYQTAWERRQSSWCWSTPAGSSERPKSWATWKARMRQSVSAWSEGTYTHVFVVIRLSSSDSAWSKNMFICDRVHLADKNSCFRLCAEKFRGLWV